MLEVILDTETTGLSTSTNHRIVEIGCVELKDQISTNKIFHTYINPQREVSEDAFKIHGYSAKFLSDKKFFPEVVEDFLNFIKDKKLVIHNASFDLSFLDYELALINKKPIDKKNVVDTLELARSKYPGSQNSLDALCKRFNIGNSKREKHSALVDCQLLKEVYINLLDQQEPKLNLGGSDIVDLKVNNQSDKTKNISRKIIKISNEELELHKKFLKSSLQKNYFK
jgi:DNA polymerase-3 subunit epsilon